MKLKPRFYFHKRLRGWDFMPQCESWQMYGKPDYDYRRYYSLTLELRAFRYVAGFHLSVTRYWKKNPSE